MVNSIREASAPLRIAGSVLGLCLFDYDKFYLNSLYMIIVWTVYVCALVHLQVFFLEKKLFTRITGLIVMHSTGIIVLIAALFNIVYKKTLDKSFKALCIVDDTLKSLGISLEYQTVRRHTLITLTLVLVFTVGLIVFASISNTYLVPFPQSVYIATVLSCPLFLMNINDYYYWIILRTIADRFDRLNRYVDQLSLDRENHRRIFAKNTLCSVLKSQNGAVFRNDQYKLWIIMQLHLNLKKTSREINRICGPVFGLEMAQIYFYTIELVSFFYVMCVRPDKLTIKKAVLLFSKLVFLLWHLVKPALVNCVYENIHRKSNGMEAVLTNFIDTVHDIESTQQAHQYLMQMRQSPLLLTGLGFIIFGHKCVISMSTSIWETVVLMIQMGGMGHADYINNGNNTSLNNCTTS